MKSTTGLSVEHFNALAHEIRPLIESEVPPILGVRKALRTTLIYLRRNRTQADIAETLGVSQPTISRAIAAVTPALAELLTDDIPTAEDLSTDTVYVVDGTLLPCWSWADHPDLWSGKHKTTGLNVQVAGTLTGRLAWVSDPLPGSTHDLTALRTSDVLHGHDHANWIADLGFTGNHMTTGIKKPPRGELTDDEKNFNNQINKLRWVIEQTISHLKNWRALHTDYRRPLHTFPTTITAILGLHFSYTA